MSQRDRNEMLYMDCKLLGYYYMVISWFWWSLLSLWYLSISIVIHVLMIGLVRRLATCVIVESVHQQLLRLITRLSYGMFFFFWPNCYSSWTLELFVRELPHVPWSSVLVTLSFKRIIIHLCCFAALLTYNSFGRKVCVLGSHP